MDDNTPQQPTQPVNPNPQPTDPSQTAGPTQPTQPQPAVSMKTLFMLAGLLSAMFIIGAGYLFVVSMLQKNQAPDRRSQPAQLVSPQPTQATAMDLPTGMPSSNNSSNGKRKKDLVQIQEGIFKYKTAKGTLPPQITTTEQAIAKEGADLCSALVPSYIPSLPKDPLSEEDMNAPIGSVKDCASMYITGYVIAKNEEGIVTIRAPFAQEETIVVKF
jgi:hypothetical protein